MPNETALAQQEPLQPAVRRYALKTSAPPRKGLVDYDRDLSEEQRAVALCDPRPTLVIAGAGSGKTRALTFRVAHLLETGTAPEKILLLTFTNKAAREMMARVGQLCRVETRRMWGGTFHHVAHGLLREHASRLGYADRFGLLDREDAKEVMASATADLGYGVGQRRFPRPDAMIDLYSTAVNTQRPLAEAIAAETPQFVVLEEEILRVARRFAERKAQMNAMDFDDLLLNWKRLLIEVPGARESICRRFSAVLVDEYQDTNRLQGEIVDTVAAPHGNVLVVGDDAQSIYSFRGANFRNILDFPKQFAGATIVALEQNYRSTQPILNVTNTVISRAAERFTKNLWTQRTGGEAPWLVAARDEQQQTRFVVDRILELHEEGTPLAEIAVLFRAGYMSADLEIELTNRKIPFEKWGGLKFLEAAHVKDVLAFLRILENPRDEVSWYRLLLLLPGIGDATARAAIDAMAAAAWESTAFGRYNPPPRARAAHAALVDLLDGLRSGPIQDVAQVAADIARVRLLYDNILRERYDRVEPRLADLDQLQTIAAGYPDRATFLSALALEPPQATQDLATGTREEDDCLILSTAHSAKGKEWDAVFVIWAVDGWFPSARCLNNDEETEEERRLMYVALTRARNHLNVAYPLNAYSSRRGAEYSLDQLCRFIDRGVRDNMQRVALSNENVPVPADEVRKEPLLDLRALLRSRFGA